QRPRPPRPRGAGGAEGKGTAPAPRLCHPWLRGHHCRSATFLGVLRNFGLVSSSSPRPPFSRDATDARLGEDLPADLPPGLDQSIGGRTVRVYRLTITRSNLTCIGVSTGRGPSRPPMCVVQ